MSNNELMQLDQLRGLGEIFVTSGFFADSKDASQAIVKILAGRELGFGPIASMTGVYIVNGRPALSANLIAARIKGSGRYDYRVKELDNQKCSIEFFNVENHRAPESLGVSTFSLEDARKAGTKNLDRYPRNMLFARTLTNGARWYCPDVFNGGIYTPDELGASVDEDGSVIEMPPVAAELPKSEQPAAPPPGYVPPADKVHVPSHENGNGEKKPARPYSLDLLRRAIATRAEKTYAGRTITAGHRGQINGALDALLGGNADKRHEFLFAVTGHKSSKDIADNYMESLWDWVNGDLDTITAEANNAIVESLKAQGQTVLPLH